MVVKYADETTYLGVYAGVRRDLVQDEDPFWPLLLAKTCSLAAAGLQAAGPGPVLQPQTEVIALYETAVNSKVLFDEVFEDVARRSKGVFHSSGLKDMFRCFEKALMAEEAEGEGPPAEAGVGARVRKVCDVVRGMLVYERCEDLLAGLELVLGGDSKVELLRSKPRFARPTSGGWMDLLMNVRLREDGSGHVCEVQFVLEKFWVVRKWLKGHDKYARYRSAVEMMEVHGSLAAFERPKGAALVQVEQQFEGEVQRLVDELGRHEGTGLDAGRDVKELMGLRDQMDALQKEHDFVELAFTLERGLARPRADRDGSIEGFLEKHRDVQLRVDGLQQARQLLRRRVQFGLVDAESQLQRYLDPTDGAIMFDPVRAQDGRVYEREKMELWIAGRPAGGLVSPVTREPMGGGELTPEPMLKKEIQDVRACMTRLV